MDHKQRTAEAILASAADRVDDTRLRKVAEMLRTSGRYGDEAFEVARDVLAAEHAIDYGVPVSDLPA